MSEKKDICIQIHGQTQQDPDCGDREQEFWIDIMEKRIVESFSQSSDDDLTLHMLKEQLRYMEC